MRQFLPNTSEKATHHKYTQNIPASTLRTPQHHALAVSSELPEPTPKHKSKLCFAASYLFQRKKHKNKITKISTVKINPIHNQTIHESVFFSDSAERKKRRTLRGNLLVGAKETTRLLLGSVWLCVIFPVRDRTTNLLPHVFASSILSLNTSTHQTACLALARKTPQYQTPHTIYTCHAHVQSFHTTTLPYITCILLQTECLSPLKILMLKS